MDKDNRLELQIFYILTEHSIETLGDQKRVCREIAALFQPMSCGHPPGCVVSAHSADGVDTTSHCAWCADIHNAVTETKAMERDNWSWQYKQQVLGELEAAESERDNLRLTVHDLEVTLDESRRWRQHFMHQLSIARIERDALLEKLEAAENIADRCISALDDIIEHVPTAYVTAEIENTFTVGLAWRAANE